MLQKRLILIVSAVVLTFLLFLLPKIVVENDQSEIEPSSGAIPENAQIANDTFEHGVTIDEGTQVLMSHLREKLSNSEINEKSITFADSLVTLFREVGKLDSAAKYLEWKALNFPNEENITNAGIGYYEAFGFAVDQNKLDNLGKKTRSYLDQVLENHPERLDLKSKIAMTYVSSPSPMRGIIMLREVIEEDPENVEAIFNLGLLSRQSNQYGKAVQRFEKLISIDESNIQARFLLGLSYLDLGEGIKAKQHFEIIKNTTDDPAVRATVEGYLEDIN